MGTGYAVSNRLVAPWVLLLSVAGCSGAPGESDSTGVLTNQGVVGADTATTTVGNPPLSQSSRGSNLAGSVPEEGGSGVPAGDNAALEGALAQATGDGVGAAGEGFVEPISGVGFSGEGEPGAPSSGVPAGDEAVPPAASVPAGSGAAPTPVVNPEEVVEGVEEELPVATPTPTTPQMEAPAPVQQLTPAPTCGGSGSGELSAAGASDSLILNFVNVGEVNVYLDWQVPWARLDYAIDGEDVVAYHRADPFPECSVMQSTEEPCERVGSSVLTSFTLLPQHSLGSSGVGSTGASGPFRVDYACGACQCGEQVPLPAGPFLLTVCTYPEIVCPDGADECSAQAQTGPNVGAVVAGTPTCHTVEAEGLSVDIELH